MTYEEYSALRDAKGLTDYKVAQETKISRTTLSEWKSGKYEPKADKIRILERFFGIEIEENTPDFNPVHIELIALYEKLNKEQQDNIMSILRSLAN